MREERKKEASKIKQTNKAKQHSTHMYMYQRLFSSLTENEGAGGSVHVHVHVFAVLIYTCIYILYTHVHTVDVLRRDEKEGRSKQGQTNKAK